MYGRKVHIRGYRRRRSSFGRWRRWRRRHDDVRYGRNRCGDDGVGGLGSGRSAITGDRALGGGGAAATGGGVGAGAALVSLGSVASLTASGPPGWLASCGFADTRRIRGSQIHITATWMSSDRMKASHTRGTATTAPRRGESSLQCLMTGSIPGGGRAGAGDVSLRHRRRKRASTQSKKVSLTVPVHYRRPQRAKF